MELSEFALGRDLLYFAGACAGIALGYGLNIFVRRTDSAQVQNKRITLILLFASAMIASLTGAVIGSNGAIFGDPKALLVTLIIMAPFVLAVLFPLKAAYPLIIAGGVFAVWLACVCLRFPAAEQPAALISHNGKAIVPSANSKEISLPEDNLSSLDFSVVVIQPGRYFPVVGGNSHVRLMHIGDGAKTFYSNKPTQKSKKFLGLIIQPMHGNISLEKMKPGAELPVYVADLK